MALYGRKKVVAAVKAALPIRGNTGARGWNWYYKAKANAEIEEAVVEFPDNETSVERKKAFFDVGINDENQGRIIFELANDLVPTGASNFLAFCGGVEIDSEIKGYKGTNFHTVKEGFMIQGGDIDGKGGRCVPELSNDISGLYFKDECLTISHSIPGILSMACPGVDGNGSEFFITTTPAQHLDSRHQVIGRVIEGLDVVKKLSSVFAINGEPVTEIVITDCGEA